MLLPWILQGCKVYRRKYYLVFFLKFRISFYNNEETEVEVCGVFSYITKRNMGKESVRMVTSYGKKAKGETS